MKREARKKDGCCRVVYLICKRFATKKRDEKSGVSQVMDLKLTKNTKEKQQKKMGVGQSCVFK